MIQVNALLANMEVVFSQASDSVDDDSLKMLIVGVVFSLIHLLSPWLASYRERVEPGFTSLCGGFAAGFVFLELLPGIGNYHELIGKRIYGFILIGFAAFYGLECYLDRKRRSGFSSKTEYYIGMALAFIYNLLLANTLGSAVGTARHSLSASFSTATNRSSGSTSGGTSSAENVTVTSASKEPAAIVLRTSQ